MGGVENEFRSSPLALAVLSLLHAAPLHPYGIQRLLKQWGKDHVINVGQRANLYKTIRRLDQAGLIAVRQTERDQQYPERTVYELTEAGRQATQAWLSEMLARPRNEFPQFPAALSFVMLLSPPDAAVVLDRRAAAIRGELTSLEATLAEVAFLPRIVLMDDEYQRAMYVAELAWLDSLTAELRSGSLTWSDEDFAGLAGNIQPGGEQGDGATGISAD